MTAVPATAAAYPLPPGCGGQAVALLYQQHQRWLQNWLRLRLGHDGDAADLAQDVFVRLLRKSEPPALEGPAQARAYLGKIASDLCANLWRRRALEQAWLDALAAQPPALAPSPEQQAIVLETLREIGSAILSLPGRGAPAFILACVHGMSEQEAAQALGLSTRTVRKHVARGVLACMQLKARYHAQGLWPGV